ncbi:MAG TPA: RNA methyltransferase [Actinobacteria bacterium]|nr:RNA methyltransferase [Actinomycetota bacterium]
MDGTSADPRSLLRDLRDHRFRRRFEAAEGIFVAETLPVVERVLEAGCEPLEALVVERIAATRPDLVARLGSVVEVVSRARLDEIAGFPVHRGVLGAFSRRGAAPTTPPAVVGILVGIGDAENLGAIFRSAAALGVDELLLDATCADPWSRRCVRVSMGTVPLVPWRRGGSGPELVVWAERSGLTTVALTPGPDAPELDALPSPVALVLGSEGPGLDPATLAAASLRRRIPMARGVDSLNVGHAAAIAFHLAVRGDRARAATGPETGSRGRPDTAPRGGPPRGRSSP